MSERDYYLSRLQYLEYLQLETVGEILQAEVDIYDLRKLLLEASELGQFDHPEIDKIKLWYQRLKNEHKQAIEALDEIELDLTHIRFMLKRLDDGEEP